MDPRLERLLDLLDDSIGDSIWATVGTSVRLPGNLRDAAVLAAELGLVASIYIPLAASGGCAASLRGQGPVG